jgi:hypothetical protein
VGNKVQTSNEKDGRHRGEDQSKWGDQKKLPAHQLETIHSMISKLRASITMALDRNYQKTSCICLCYFETSVNFPLKLSFIPVLQMILLKFCRCTAIIYEIFEGSF